jgi:hypothetical protein
MDESRISSILIWECEYEEVFCVWESPKTHVPCSKNFLGKPLDHIYLSVLK